MSLQWYSPVEAAVADVVRRHIGIAPTRSECAAALGRYRHGSYLDAAKEVYAAERQQLELLSLEQRAPAHHRVRAENCYVEPQQPAWGGVDLATGGIGEQMVRTEDGVAAARDYMFGSQLTSTDGASASGAMPLLGSISANNLQHATCNVQHAACSVQRATHRCSIIGCRR